MMIIQARQRHIASSHAIFSNIYIYRVSERPLSHNEKQKINKQTN